MKSRILILCFMLLGWSMVLSQEPIGGPYTPDENTVALFHFDGDLSNAASTGGSATGNGNVTFEAGMTGFGQAVFLHNEFLSDTTLVDSSWLSFADIPELDLTGDWTIEGWFKYADTTRNSLNNPSYLISKRDTLGNLNYGVNVNFDGPSISTNYTSLEPDPAFAGSPGVGVTFQDPQTLEDRPEEVVNKWIHFTYQRDANLRIVTVAANDENGDLLYFDWVQSHPKFDVPVSSTLPLLLGRLAEGESGFFHGYLDEVRVSNTVRYFDFPPVISATFFKWNNEYSKLIQNPLASDPNYPVDMNIFVPGSESGVQSADVNYRIVGDPYQKVAADDPSWQQVPMSQDTGVLWSGAIPAQPGGTMIQHYTEATSTTGKTSDYFAWPDSNYDSFGAMFSDQDIMLKLSFEEDDLEFVDSSQYNHQLFKLGQWAIYDDPEDQVEGEFAAWFIEGTNAIGEIVSPFLSLQEYTVDYWYQPDTGLGNGNEYQISYLPGANLKDPLSTRQNFGSGPFSTGPWFIDNYAILWRGALPTKNYGNDTYILDLPGAGGIPWQWGATSIPVNDLGRWYHIWSSVGPDSLIMQVNVLEGDNEVTIDRVVRTKEELGVPGDVTPFTPSFGKFRIGPGAIAPPDVHPFLAGKMDRVIVQNYQEDKGPIVAIDDDLANRIIEKYQLEQNYPNPFNPATTIEFMVPKTLNQFSLKVYDNLGRLVKTLHDGRLESGKHKLKWDGTNNHGQSVATGVYFYKMKTKGYAQTKMMLLLK